MEEPSETTEGQEPEAVVEGREPEREPAEDGKKPEPRTFSESYVRGLRKEAAEARTRSSTMEAELKELRERDLSESEKLQERAAANERRAEEAERRLLRFEIAAQHELGLKAANFLVGSTREEMEASADELVKLLAEQSSPAPSSARSFDGGARTTPAQRETPEVEHNKLVLKALGR